MEFRRRLRLYLTGVFFGILIVWLLLFRGRERDLDGWLPNERVMSSLVANPLEITPVARCQMDCRNIVLEDIRNTLRHGKVDFSKSDPDATPCKQYAVENSQENKSSLRVVFGNCDSLTTVIAVIDLNSANGQPCNCH